MRNLPSKLIKTTVEKSKTEVGDQEGQVQTALGGSTEQRTDEVREEVPWKNLSERKKKKQDLSWAVMVHTFNSSPKEEYKMEGDRPLNDV